MGKDLRAAVQQYFKEFDQLVGESVFNELQKTGGLPRLLKKLGLPAEADSNANYAILIQYFRRKGTNDFLQLVGAQKLDYRIQPTSGQLRSGDAGSDKQRAISGGDRSGVVPLMLRGESSRPPPRDSRASGTGARNFNSSVGTPLPQDVKMQTPAPVQQYPPTLAAGSVRPPSPYDAVDDKGFPKGPLMAAPSPAPGTVPANALPFDPSKPHDPTGIWPHVERRSGRERRRQADRRKALEVTFKNRRYGKDRRKTEQERRKNWPKDGFRP
ncbi:MAG: hypothetical protein ABI579_08395 [Candidatus Sumerlaeota bacterium]